jgi:small-conductance mechanosensitive channel
LAYDVAEWFCSNIEILDYQSLQLIEYLNKAVIIGSMDYDSQLIINTMIFLKIVSVDPSDFAGFTMIVVMMHQMESFISLIKKKIALHEPFNY